MTAAEFDLEMRLRRHAEAFRRAARPAPDLHARIMARVAAQAPPARPAAPSLMLQLAAMVAALLLVAGAWTAIQHLRERRMASPSPGVQAVTPIPWIDARPGLATPIPPPAPTPIPAGTGPCRASDLKAVFGASNALTGGKLVADITFGNRGQTPCVLQGVPGIRLFDPSGREILLKLSTGPQSAPVLVQPGTADLQPYSAVPGTASLRIIWPTHDGAGACSPAPSPGTRLEIELPGGGTLDVPVVDLRNRALIAACGGLLNAGAFQAVAPSQPPPTLASPRLQPQLDAPRSIAAGQVLHYKVSLKNISREAIAFGSTCPAYLEWAVDVAQTQTLAKELYVLNCGPIVGAIQPGQTVTFAMDLTVPAAAKPGSYMLYWHLSQGTDSEAAAKTPLEVTR